MQTPEVYVSFSDVQGRNSATKIEEFQEELSKISGKCMDIGCGPGNITRNILLPSLDPNAVLIGTDISEDMVEFANNKYNIDKRLIFEVLDIETKNLPKKYISEFDHIFSMYCMHWIGDIRQAFENIYRMLKPGGTMLVTFLASHNLFHSIKELSQKDRYSPYLNEKASLLMPFVSSGELKKFLRSIGFNVLHCSLRTETYYDSMNTTNKLISAVVNESIISCLNDMPEEIMEEVKKHIAHQYLKQSVTFSNTLKEQTLLDVFQIFFIYAKS